MCLSQVVLFVSNATAPSKNLGTAPNWPPRFPFAHIGIDFLRPLPISNGNSYISLFGDHFTKWYEAVPLPDQTAEMTATALLEHWISRFGVRVSIHTDQGRKFESKLFQSLMHSLQIDKTRTTSFRPQSNAVIERMSRTLLTCWPKLSMTSKAIGLSNFRM